MTSRSYCITSYGVDQKVLPHEKVKYCVWQLEKGAKSGRLHYQMYVELNSPQRYGMIRKWLGTKSLKILKRKGTPAQAREYCMKERTRVEGPFEIGEWKDTKQGNRTDLQEIAKVIKKNSLEEAIDLYPEVYIRYHSGMEKLSARMIKKKTKNFRKVEVHYIYGPTGCGKTRGVVEKEENLYIYSPLSTTSEWWDGYEGEEAILLDDYRDGWFSLSRLLNILDGYQLRMGIKGSHTYAQWTRVYITSNVSIEDSMFGKYPELRRRVSHVTKCG